jgi:o-succinylbenzoate synthase
MKASYQKYILEFKRPGGTSRGVLTHKVTWFIKLENNGNLGIGECGLLKGLSYDDVPEYEEILKWTCQNIHLGIDTLYNELKSYPSIQFGLEIAFRSLSSSDSYILFPSDFTNGKSSIPINGLIWMGTKYFMLSQIKDKIQSGFKCLKMKIGAFDFNTELQILKSIRKEFSLDDIELRVDANGAFTTAEALEKLKRLSEFDLHSIEQPINPNQHEDMAKLCDASPIPIALDEELIGVISKKDKQRVLETIKPQYIILKPSFIGGYRGSQEWIDLATINNVGWWVTSALESNIGLNAIAQWTYNLNSSMPQGLGTGGLFVNNFFSPLKVKNGKLHHDPIEKWNVNLFEL